MKPTNYFRVMDKNLSGYKLAGNDINHLKQYCYGDDVIVSLEAVIIGFKIRFLIMPFEKIIKKHYGINMINILWLHIGYDFEKHDKTDKIVWRKNEKD